MNKVKKYKSGEQPHIGDLVVKNYANVDYPRQYCYGIVMGQFVLQTSRWQFPLILWGGRGRPQKSLLGNVRLISRRKDNK